MRQIMFLCVCMLVSINAYAQSDPLLRTQQLLKAFEQVKVVSDDQSLSHLDKISNQEAFKTLDHFFNYEKLVNNTIDPFKKTFKSHQLNQYRITFKKLIRLIAYQRSSMFLHHAMLTVKTPVLSGKKADVEIVAKSSEQDSQTNIIFHWLKEKDKWMIVDVSLDGTSVVKDYQNQFARILKKEGVDGFIKKLVSRLGEEQKNDAT